MRIIECSIIECIERSLIENGLCICTAVKNGIIINFIIFIIISKQKRHLIEMINSIIKTKI